MKNFGKVLWFRERDGFGVIVDSKGGGFYFDSSVIPKSSRLNKNSYVQFSVHYETENTIKVLLMISKLRYD